MVRSLRKVCHPYCQREYLLGSDQAMFHQAMLHQAMLDQTTPHIPRPPSPPAPLPPRRLGWRGEEERIFRMSCGLGRLLARRGRKDIQEELRIQRVRDAAFYTSPNTFGRREPGYEAVRTCWDGDVARGS